MSGSRDEQVWDMFSGPIIPGRPTPPVTLDKPEEEDRG